MYLYTVSAPTLLVQPDTLLVQPDTPQVEYFHMLAKTGMHQETEIH